MPWLSHFSPSARIHPEQLSPLCFWQVLSSSNSLEKAYHLLSSPHGPSNDTKPIRNPVPLGEGWQQSGSGVHVIHVESLWSHTGTVWSWSRIWHCPAQHDPTWTTGCPSHSQPGKHREHMAERAGHSQVTPAGLAQ